MTNLRVPLHFMNAAPSAGPMAFGLPWPKGTLKADEPLFLQDLKGLGIPCQNSVRATWPDGSVKWTLHRAVLPHADGFEVVSNPPEKTAETAKLSVERKDKLITVSTGTMICTLALEQEHIIESITRPDGRLLCSQGRLVALNEQRFSQNGYEGIKAIESFHGSAFYAFVEEEGPLRAVIRLRGSHIGRVTGMRTTSTFRKWLTFDLRLYFFAGSDDIRLVHTFQFDGREEEDFIAGIGLEFDLPLPASPFNRYVRFMGESGLFAESPKSLWVRQKRAYDAFYADQLDGKEVLFDAQMLLNDMTEWQDFKQTHLSSREYVISKRTQENCVYVRAASGGRAPGLVYAGCPKNGLAAFRQDFWQKFPSSLEASNMLTGTGTIKVWLYSPDAAPMDMRHYDTKTHVDACYEGFEEMRASAYGIANTNEVYLKVYDAFPGNEVLIASANEWQSPNLLLAPVEHYIASGVFGGVFSPVDRSTNGRTQVEDALDAQFDFYLKEREQSNWYGFWDFGDIRHAYDAIRHSWRYDMGGFAWQNTELAPNLWLWFAFLRSQREDIFRFARAMSRHTSEVDLYHAGDYKLLGSRHNVVHWGCGCKEGRIGLCLLHKVFYYLTGDERIGDIMDEEKDVDEAIAHLPPLRAYFTPDPRFKVHIRFGPDVLTIAENWLTRWERYGDTRYRDKLMKMLSYFKAPGSFAAHSIWGYDPRTGNMERVERSTGVHFNHVFGTVYILEELFSVIEDADLNENYMDMGQIYLKEFAKREDWCKAWGISSEGFTRMTVYYAGVCAAAAMGRADEELAGQVWDTLLRSDGSQGDQMRVPIVLRTVDSPRVHKVLQEAEGAAVSGNAASQWGCYAITALAMIGDKLP